MSTGIALAIIAAGFLIFSGLVTAAIILSSGPVEEDDQTSYDEPTALDWDSIKRAGLR